jgi:septum formation topological specificity factor MinE
MDHVRDPVAAGRASVVLARDRDRSTGEPAYLYVLREEFALLRLGVPTRPRRP